MTLVVASMIVSPSFAAIAPSTQNSQNNLNIAKSGDIVTLSGQGIDPDDDTLTISWKQVGGEDVELTPSNTVAEPSFKAPDVQNGKAKILSFELTVTDPYGEVGKSVVKVTVLPRNQSPTADAGADQTVTKGDQVTLNGSGTDPEGDSLTYRWSQVDGPTVSIDDPTSQSPSFDTSDVIRSSAIFKFQLAVFDGFGGSATDTVLVKMNAAKATLITANAGPDQTVDEKSTVQLDGTCDDKLNRSLTMTWTQTLGPAVELSSTADSSVTFTAPEVPNGPLVPSAFRFTCQADGGGTATDVVLIKIKPVNESPSALAGNDKITMSNRIVYLNGDGTDPDGDKLQYSWKQVSGADVKIASPTSPEGRFKAPSVSGGSSEELEFELTVTDPFGLSSTDTVKVTVKSDNVRASADAGQDQVVDEQSQVTLSGSGTDPENGSLKYAWKQVGGESVQLSDANAQDPTFTAPVVANGKIKILVFELRVADDNGFPSKDTMKVTVMPVNSVPVVSAGDDQTVDGGATVSLEGTATDEDNESLTYLWTQTAGPSVVLSNPTDLSTGFVAPKLNADTVFTFQLIANDGNVDSEPATVNVTVKGTVVTPIVANAGKDQQVSEKSSVTLLGSGKDPLLNKLTYGWKQVSGETVTLSSSTIAKPSFTAPEVANGQTKTLVFEITVGDSHGRVGKDTVSIVVNPVDSAPTAIAKVKTIHQAQ